jgi:hypothetical protein
MVQIFLTICQYFYPINKRIRRDNVLLSLEFICIVNHAVELHITNVPSSVQRNDSVNLINTAVRSLEVGVPGLRLTE